MWPTDPRRHAVTTLRAEAAIGELALAAYREWLPHARDAALPTLTAAADDLPPQINGPGDSQGWWEAILDHLLLPGIAMIIGWQATAALAAMGGLPPEPPEPASTDRPAPQRTPTPPASTAQAQQWTILARATTTRHARISDHDLDETARLLATLPTIEETIRGYLEDVRNRMVATPDDIFRTIATDLADGIESGESIDEQRKRVQAHLDAHDLNLYQRRAETVARTETAGALSQSTLAAAEEHTRITGEPLEQAWLATIGGRTRRTHLAADGQRRRIGEPFNVGGHDLRYPGDPRGPAHEVINCRCALQVLAPDEALPAETDRHTERGPGSQTVRERDGISQAEFLRRKRDEGIIRARDDPDGEGTTTAPITASIDTGGPMEEFRQWEGILAPLGTRSDDSRMLSTDLDLTIRDGPLPLLWQRQSVPEHNDAYTVGSIRRAWISDGVIHGEGILLNTAEADEAAAQITEGITRPSVDLADATMILIGTDGEPLDEDALIDAMESGDSIEVIDLAISATLIGATLVAKPAFGTTRITVLDELTDDDDALPAVMVAAGHAPTRPPRAWFDPQPLDGPTPLVVTPEGRVHGTLAAAGTCHIGNPSGDGRCITAPGSDNGFPYFHLGHAETAEGDLVPVGKITLGAGHAKPDAGFRAAVDHYDNTATAAAVVRAYHDEAGNINVFGALVPGVSAEQRAELMRSPLSGDWRRVGGRLELVAALAVNVPGFPVPVRRTDTAGMVASLVAAGSVPHDRRAARHGVDVDAVARQAARAAIAEQKADAARRDRLAALGEHASRRRAALAAALRDRNNERTEHL